jgi:hypothetical protein
MNMHATVQKSSMAGALHTPINYIQKAEARIMAVLRADPAERQVNDLAEALDALRAARVSLVTPIENDKRTDIRLEHSVASYFLMDEAIVDCEIIDLSPGGAMILLDRDVSPGSRLMLSIPLGGALEAVVVGCGDNRARLKFTSLPEECAEAIRRLTWSKLAG